MFKAWGLFFKANSTCSVVLELTTLDQANQAPFCYLSRCKFLALSPTSAPPLSPPFPPHPHQKQTKKQIAQTGFSAFFFPVEHSMVWELGPALQSLGICLLFLGLERVCLSSCRGGYQTLPCTICWHLASTLSILWRHFIHTPAH